jgi:hypothetical protein
MTNVAGTRRVRNPPWQRTKANLPHRSTLQRWRVRADKLAKEKGCRWSCDLCKVALKRCYGWVWLRVPGPWRVRPTKRRLCYSCFLQVDTFIKQLEAESCGVDWPPDEF